MGPWLRWGGERCATVALVNSRTALLFSLLALGACGSSATTATNITAPTSTRCEANVTTSAASFAPTGGTGTLAITVARECSWRASTPVSWITFTTAAEGQGDGTVGYRIAENEVPVPRQAMLTVAERQVPLSQQAAPCRYTVGGVPSSIGAQGDQTEIDLRTHSACSWTARSETEWASITPASGNGNAVLRLTVAANTGGARPVRVVIAGESFTATQSGAPAPAPQPPPAPPAPTPPPPPPTPPPTPPPPTPPPPTPPPPTPPPGPVPVLEIALDGEIRGLSGACASWRFELEGRIVYTTSQTEFSRGSCSRMQNGLEIEIRGWLMSDGTVRADHVRYEDD